MDIEVGYLLKALLLPPVGNLLLVLVGSLMRRRHRRTGRGFVVAGLGSLLLMTLPPVAQLLAKPLEPDRVFDVTKGAAGAEAVVVLGGGLDPDAIEYAGVAVLHARTYQRLRYGVFLHRLLDLPLAVTGGTLLPGYPAEALVMQDVLQQDFQESARWIEIESRNTAENAILTRRLLPARRILLVTNALHMWRARRIFEAAGFEVVPAAVGFRTFAVAEEAPTLPDYLPSVQALALSRDALHEYLGGLWYGLRYRNPAAPLD